MRRSSFLKLPVFVITLQLSFSAYAQDADVVKPADCMAEARDAVASVEYGGKTYHFKSVACKEQFQGDPERYSQLYDALLELKNAGKPTLKPKPLDNASAVPS